MTPQGKTALRSLGARNAAMAMSPQAKAQAKSMAGTQKLIKAGKPTGLRGESPARKKMAKVAKKVLKF